MFTIIASNVIWKQMKLNWVSRAARLLNPLNPNGGKKSGQLLSLIANAVSGHRYATAEIVAGLDKEKIEIMKILSCFFMPPISFVGAYCNPKADKQH